MSAITCKVKELTLLNDHVYHVELITDQPYSFKAGQYLLVVMGENDKRPFSIASCPDEKHLELHIGAAKQNNYALEVIDWIKHHNTLEVEVGLGEAHLRTDSDRPILLIAGGTGFSYVQSIARHLASTHSDKEVLLYWGGKDPQSMYAHQQMLQWEQDNRNFRYIPAVLDANEQWQGRTGFIHKAAMEDIDNLQDYDIYIAGHFDMIKVVKEEFIPAGALFDHMYADAFSYGTW